MYAIRSYYARQRDGVRVDNVDEVLDPVGEVAGQRVAAVDPDAGVVGKAVVGDGQLRAATGAGKRLAVRRAAA